MTAKSPIPLLDLKAQYATIRDEIRAAIDRVLESQRFILGPEVEALEQEIAAYSRCAHAIGVSSGTDAVLAALMAIDIQPGDEVITSPYSFFATAGAVARLGAKPVIEDAWLAEQILQRDFRRKLSSRRDSGCRTPRQAEVSGSVDPGPAKQCDLLSGGFFECLIDRSAIRGSEFAAHLQSVRHSQLPA